MEAGTTLPGSEHGPSRSLSAAPAAILLASSMIGIPDTMLRVPFAATTSFALLLWLAVGLNAALAASSSFSRDQLRRAGKAAIMLSVAWTAILVAVGLALALTEVGPLIMGPIAGFVQVFSIPAVASCLAGRCAVVLSDSVEQGGGSLFRKSAILLCSGSAPLLWAFTLAPMGSTWAVMYWVLPAALVGWTARAVWKSGLLSRRSRVVVVLIVALAAVATCGLFLPTSWAPTLQLVAAFGLALTLTLAVGAPSEA